MLICEICGKPATNAAFDIETVNDWTMGMKISKTISGPHCYCDEHRRDSTQIFGGDIASKEQREKWERE